MTRKLSISLINFVLLFTIDVAFCVPNTNQTITATVTPKNGTMTTTTTTPSTVASGPPTSTKNGTADATIYTMAHFRGAWWTLDLSEGCVKVPGYLYRKASSIDTHDNCVHLYAAENCTARSITVAPGTNGHSDFSDVDFDKTLVSLELCDLPHFTTTTKGITTTITPKSSTTVKHENTTKKH